MFDLNASHVFVCVVEEQGFTAAASRLGMPKQTISRRITELEETLGVRLLERSTRKIRMTRVGELFFSHAQQIVHTAELAEESVFQTKLEPSGTLHLATLLHSNFGSHFTNLSKLSFSNNDGNPTRGSVSFISNLHAS